MAAGRASIRATGSRYQWKPEVYIMWDLFRPVWGHSRRLSNAGFTPDSGRIAGIAANDVKVPQVSFFDEVDVFQFASQI